MIYYMYENKKGDQLLWKQNIGDLEIVSQGWEILEKVA